MQIEKRRLKRPFIINKTQSHVIDSHISEMPYNGNVDNVGDSMPQIVNLTPNNNSELTHEDDNENDVVFNDINVTENVNIDSAVEYTSEANDSKSDESVTDEVVTKKKRTRKTAK